jgi:serine/threonine protein kinase
VETSGWQPIQPDESLTDVPLAPLRAALRKHKIVSVFHAESRPLTSCYTGVHSSSQTKVFIKVLRSNVPNVRRNFRREVAIILELGGQAGFPVPVATSCDLPFYFHACRYIASSTFVATGLGENQQSIASVMGKVAALARWIAELHKRGYSHRDLSPEHVFLSDGGALTVVDFGMAKRALDATAAETALHMGYDIQAFGMILWELICGKSLFLYRDHCLANSIRDEMALIHSTSIPNALVQLLIGCLSARSEFTPMGIEPFRAIWRAEDVACAVSELAVDEVGRIGHE